MDTPATPKSHGNFGRQHTQKAKKLCKKAGAIPLKNKKLALLTNANQNHIKVLDILAEKGRKGEKIVKGEVLKLAGYSQSVQDAPSKVFERRSFLELADELLPDDLILNSLRTDILKKPQRRYQELALGAKIKGMLVDRVEQKTTVQGFIVLPERQLPQWYEKAGENTRLTLDKPDNVVPAIEEGGDHQEPESML